MTGDGWCEMRQPASGYKRTDEAIRSCRERSLEVILQYHEQIRQHSSAATQSRIDDLEERLEALNVKEEQEEMERYVLLLYCIIYARLLCFFIIIDY